MNYEHPELVKTKKLIDKLKKLVNLIKTQESEKAQQTLELKLPLYLSIIVLLLLATKFPLILYALIALATVGYCFELGTDVKPTKKSVSGNQEENREEINAIMEAMWPVTILPYATVLVRDCFWGGALNMAKPITFDRVQRVDKKSKIELELDFDWDSDISVNWWYGSVSQVMIKVNE